MGCSASKEVGVILTELREIRREVNALKQDVHALKRGASSEKTVQLIHGGAMFYLLDPLRDSICCGFFVQSDIALTVAHGLRKSGFHARSVIHAISSRTPPDRLDFLVVFQDDTLDFAVLRLIGSRAVPSAFFTIAPATADVSAGRKLQMVSMSLGSRQYQRSNFPLPPTICVDAVMVRRKYPTNLVYDVSAWRGDCDAVLAVDNGIAMAMHVVVVHEPPVSSLVSERRTVSASASSDRHYLLAINAANAAMRADTAIRQVARYAGEEEGEALILSIDAVSTALANAAAGHSVVVSNPLRVPHGDPSELPVPRLFRHDFQQGADGLAAVATAGGRLRAVTL